MNELPALHAQSIDVAINAVLDTYKNHRQSLDETIKLLRDQHTQLGEDISNLTTQRETVANEIERLVEIRRVLDTASTDVRAVLGSVKAVKRRRNTGPVTEVENG